MSPQVQVPSTEALAVSPDGRLSVVWTRFLIALANRVNASATAPLANFPNDAAAAAGGVRVNGFYRNGSVVMVRVT